MRIDEITVGRLATEIMRRICAVCPDRNIDATCNRCAEGTCTLMAKLNPAAQTLLRVHSDHIEPYIQALRDEICAKCDLRDPDGTCAVRDTGECMLDCYLPLLVEIIEDHFGPKKGRLLTLDEAR